MDVRYDNLWKISIDEKLAGDENVTTEAIGNICRALNCTLDDIMEFYDEWVQRLSLGIMRWAE